MKSLLVDSVVYFFLVFMTGFILGTFRVLILAPAIGERYAELIEMPFMLVAIYFAAKYVVARARNRAAPTTVLAALATGAIALALLLLLEFTLVLKIQGMTLDDYLASRDPVSASAYVLGLIAFMVMPYMHIRKQLGG